MDAGALGRAIYLWFSQRSQTFCGHGQGNFFRATKPKQRLLLSLEERATIRNRPLGEQFGKDNLSLSAWAMARQAKIPPLERVAVTVEYQPRDLRHYDAENICAASGKACIDGIVAAGVIEDDECPRYVTGILCTIGTLYPKGRLVLHLTEIAATGGTDGAA